MNDKELADKVVALGVHPEETLPDDEFVRDWRVAGALMEKCIEKKIVPHWSIPLEGNLPIVKSLLVQMVSLDDIHGNKPGVRNLGQAEIHNPSEYPHAIIEACVSALEPVLEGREHG